MTPLGSNHHQQILEARSFSLQPPNQPEPAHLTPEWKGTSKTILDLHSQSAGPRITWKLARTQAATIRSGAECAVLTSPQVVLMPQVGAGAVTQTPRVGLTRLYASQGHSPRSITFYPAPPNTDRAHNPPLSDYLCYCGGWGFTWGRVAHGLSPEAKECCPAHLRDAAGHVWWEWLVVVTSPLPAGPLPLVLPRVFLSPGCCHPQGLPSSTSFPIGSCTPEKAGVMAAERTRPRSVALMHTLQSPRSSASPTSI